MRSTLTSAAIAECGRVITGEPSDYDALLDLVGDRRFVLIGVASHGTRAIEPLERSSLWDQGEPPETFPRGI
jgi:erythromycin esterase-like protein